MYLAQSVHKHTGSSLEEFLLIKRAILWRQKYSEDKRKAHHFSSSWERRLLKRLNKIDKTSRPWGLDDYETSFFGFRDIATVF